MGYLKTLHTRRIFDPHLSGGDPTSQAMRETLRRIMASPMIVPSALPPPTARPRLPRRRLVIAGPRRLI